MATTKTSKCSRTTLRPCPTRARPKTMPAPAAALCRSTSRTAAHEVSMAGPLPFHHTFKALILMHQTERTNDEAVVLFCFLFSTMLLLHIVIRCCHCHCHCLGLTTADMININFRSFTGLEGSPFLSCFFSPKNWTSAPTPSFVHILMYILLFGFVVCFSCFHSSLGSEPNPTSTK
jgi:hypothetical protein